MSGTLSIDFDDEGDTSQVTLSKSESEYPRLTISNWANSDIPQRLDVEIDPFVFASSMLVALRAFEKIDPFRHEGNPSG